ncbi:MAG: galactose mutarotase, partial [Octadecabacter sp.]
ATTEPGVHLYDARAAQRPSKPKFEGLAIECQGWPDAPNKAGFPSIEITPDTPVVQITQWQFVRT